MATEIAKLTVEAELAQAHFEELLSVYESSSDLEKIRLLTPLTESMMRRDEALFAVAYALRAL